MSGGCVGRRGQRRRRTGGWSRSGHRRITVHVVPEVPERSGIDDEITQLGDAMAQLTGRAHWLHPSPKEFDEWLLNLDDVYLNVNMAWGAVVPPSIFEANLEASGGSRRQRLARFRARDL